MIDGAVLKGQGNHNYYPKLFSNTLLDEDYACDKFCLGNYLHTKHHRNLFADDVKYFKKKNLDLLIMYTFCPFFLQSNYV